MFQRAVSGNAARQPPPPSIVGQNSAKHQSSLDAAASKKAAQARSSVVSYATTYPSNSSHTLQPVPKSSLNVVLPRTLGSVFPSTSKRPGLACAQPASILGKRPSSSQEGLLKALNTPAFSEAPAAKRREQSPPIDRTEALRQAVYFDEDDFDDDLDFDEEDIMTPVKSSKPKTTFPQKAATTASPSKQLAKTSAPRADLESFVNHAKPIKTNLHNPLVPRQEEFSIEISSPLQVKSFNSNVEIPWSSSPIEHQQLTNTAIGRPSPLPQRNVQAQVPAASVALPVKRSRKLPWPTAEERAEAEKAISMQPPAGFNHNRQAKPKLPETPSTSKSLPWNTTTSALKEAKKDLKGRSTLKKSLSTNTETNPSATAVRRGKKKETGWTMSEEQQRVIQMVVEDGKSVFFTGSAGTGKSVLLREIITGLRKKHVREQDRVAVTASTGLAACNIGGVTLHSFAGIGLGKESADVLVKKIKRNQKAKQRWLRTKVLIIDEVSMVDGELFDKLEAVARSLKNNGRPFGGLQLVVTGDFFQLPPVPDSGKIARFAFEANTWNDGVDHTIGLTHIFRQKDPVFASMLNEMRLGKLSQKSIDSFKKLNRAIQYDDGLDATELFPMRHEVENANNSKLRQLPGRAELYSSKDASAILDNTQRDRLLQNCMAPPNLELKINAQVMLIKNLDETLVNGSLGRVVGFMSEKTYALVSQEGDGMFDSEPVDDEDEEQRRRRLKIQEMFTAESNTANTVVKLPLVQFTLPDGTARRTLIQLESWKMELPTGEVQASRTQLPLILAWAISIHKAQGQTLERVKVDLGKVFEKGQAYVALSRATSQEGLQVLRFDPKKVMAHEKVRAFYESLYSVDMARSGIGRGPAMTEDEEAMAELLAEQSRMDAEMDHIGRRSAYA